MDTTGTGTRPAPSPIEVHFKGGHGLDLAGELRGGGDAPVLLAHGFGQTRQSWSATQRRLGDAGHASLAWDMRGHGQSGRNPGSQRYRPQPCADDRPAQMRRP